MDHVSDLSRAHSAEISVALCYNPDTNMKDCFPGCKRSPRAGAEEREDAAALGVGCAPTELLSSLIKELHLQDLHGNHAGRCIYRCAAFGYGAFSMYTNPWLVRAILAALWTASRLMIGMI